jgi:hypothetical protein
MAVAPSVAVEADPALHDLRRWVALRVLQEGYELAPSVEQAETTVVLRARGEDLEVETLGPAGERRFAVEGGPDALRRLELLHRVLIGVETTRDEAATTEPTIPRAPGLAVHAEGAGADALLGALLDAARADGTWVTMSPQPDDTLVCVAPRGDLVEVGIGDAADGCAPPSVVVSGTDALDVGARDVVFAARREPEPAPVADSSRDGDPTPAPDPAPGRGDDSAPVAPSVREEHAPLQGPPRAELRLGMEGGIVVRGAAIDPGMRVQTRMGAYDGIGGRLELGVIPAAGGGVRAVDTVLCVGPDWQASLGKRGRFRVGTTVGADIHSYSIVGRTAADVSWIFELPVSFSYALRGDTRIALSALPGIAGVTTSHTVGGEEVWRRTAWRVGAAIGFSYGWRVE